MVQLLSSVLKAFWLSMVTLMASPPGGAVAMASASSWNRLNCLVLGAKKGFTPSRLPSTANLPQAVRAALTLSVTSLGAVWAVPAPLFGVAAGGEAAGAVVSDVLG